MNGWLTHSPFAIDDPSCISAARKLSRHCSVFVPMLNGICACRLAMPRLCSALCSTVMSLKPTIHLGSRFSEERSRWSMRCTVP